MKPNYGAEKRRKELERKRKQEEKAQKKRERKLHPTTDEFGNPLPEGEGEDGESDGDEEGDEEKTDTSEDSPS